MGSAGATSLLLVEEAGAARDALERLLRDEGFAVHSKADGRDALASLDAGLRVDIILLDLGSPNMDGPSFRAKLRVRPACANLPVMLLTGATERALPVQVDAVVPKPFVLDELLAHIRALVPEGEAGRVLVVEDDPDVRDVVLEYLEVMGVPAMGAENGCAALAVLERGYMPSVVVTDLAMPDMDGATLIRALRQSPVHGRVPVVVASAMGTLGLTGLDVCATLRRPSEMQRLLAELRTLAPTSHAA